MPFTNIEQLRPKGSQEIEPSSGSVATLGALYYFEDIQKVVEQPGFIKLVQKDVWFERTDGENVDQRTGDPIHEITVVAAEGSNGILPIVALAWPTYYIKKSHNGTVDFPGSDTYFPASCAFRRASRPRSSMRCTPFFIRARNHWTH